MRGRDADAGAKRRAEVAVARKAEIEREIGNVIRFGKAVERARQPEPGLIAVKRNPFGAPEALRQVDAAYADLCGERLEADPAFFTILHRFLGKAHATMVGRRDRPTFGKGLR